MMQVKISSSIGSNGRSVFKTFPKIVFFMLVRAVYQEFRKEWYQK